MVHVASKDTNGWSNRSERRPPTKENESDRYLTTEEFVRLAEVLAEVEQTQTEPPSVIATIRLIILTGARVSEILELRWDQVDVEHAWLRLPDSKTGAQVIHLSPPALEVLGGIKRQDDNPYVIVGRNLGTHLVNIRKPWGRIRKKAGIEDVRIHDLRHTFASVSAELGFSLPMIGKMLGHKHQATTQKYAHFAVDPVKQAMDMVGERIMAKMKGE